MEMFVLFDAAGKVVKITSVKAEAKRHETTKGNRVESCITKKDYVKQERYGVTESGKILITPGETKFIPNGKAPAAKAGKGQEAPAPEEE